MEKPVKKPKFCPLLTIASLKETEIPLQECLGEECALYVKIVKARELKAGDITYADPERYLRFEGCGLIKNIPWNFVEFPEKKAREQ